METSRRTQTAFCAGWWLLAAALSAQAPAKKPLVKPIFENDRVRIVEVVWEPGSVVAATKLTADETLGVLGVVIRGGTLEHVLKNGKKERRERKPGELLWQRPGLEMEMRRNVSDKNMNLIQVRLKKAPLTRAYRGPVAGAKKLLENAYAAAFEHSFAPGVKSPMHKYGPRVWVVLDGGRLRAVEKDGHSSEAFLRPAQVMWLPPQEHSFESFGQTTIRAISLELK